MTPTLYGRYWVAAQCRLGVKRYTLLAAKPEAKSALA